jgi:hypothetical protein
MKTTNCLTSACRYCRFYNPEGRRGGSCQQLSVPVEANWKACSLALPPFTSAWESLEEIMLLETSYNKTLDNSDSVTTSEPQTTIKAQYSTKTLSRKNYSTNNRYFNEEAMSA